MTAADADSAELTRLSALIWSRKSSKREQLAAFRTAIGYDHPSGWAIAQAAEITHPMHTVREEALLTNARWAKDRGLPAHLWADRVAATQSRDDKRFMRLQARRLEWALRRQSVWPLEALEQIIHHNEPIHTLIRSLGWLDEDDHICWLDERAVPRDLSGHACYAKALRIAHPAHAALQGCDFSRWQQRVDTNSAPFAQWNREVFRPDTLQQDAHGWHRPRWEEPLPLYRLHQDLRRNLGWRYTHAEDNGTVAGFYLYDERADQTALWRMMNQHNEPRYGYMVYTNFHASDHPLRVGLSVLRGSWDRRRINWSYAWPPNKRSYGMQSHDLCALDEADPIFLSEVIRDVWLASMKRSANEEVPRETT